MATFKYFIKVSKKSPRATVRIRFKQGKQFDLWIKTPITLLPEHWNPNKQTLRDIPVEGKEETQKELNDLKRTIEEAFDSTTDKTRIDKNWLETQIDKFYNPDKYLSTETLFGYIQNFVDNSHKRINEKTGNPVSYKVKREYEVTFNYLKDFCKEENNGKELGFVGMDKEFKENFTEFLRKKGLHQNTIVRKITTLRIFLNDAKYDGKNPYDKYLGWKVKKIETDNIHFDETELKQLYNHDFSDNKRLEKVRDMFIVGSYTGLRFGDLTNITKENISNDLIYVKQSKTGNRVVIPLHPIVKEVLEKYNGNLPEPISNQKYNEYLKEACKLAGLTTIAPFKSPVVDEKTGKTVLKHLPKYQLVGSHTARRSFATNMYLAGMETLHIRSITGHKTESAFLKYIKVSPEQHAKKIVEFWQKQGEFIKTAK